jgi:putative endonuclease
MVYYTYILISEKNGRRYFGSTENLQKRLAEHNAGKVRSTKAYLPYSILYFETFEQKTQARKRELYFKTVNGYKELKLKGII